MLIFSIGAGVDEIEGDGEGECYMSKRLLITSFTHIIT